MALVPHKITALAESDADGTDGKNIIAGAVVSLFDSSGAAVTLFDDESGNNGSTAKQTDSSGQVVVWVTPGEYSESVNGSPQRAVTIGGRTITSYANTESMQNSRPTQMGQRAENRERANAQYELAVSGYSASSGDIVSANGRVWKLVKQNGIKIETLGYTSGDAKDFLEAAADYCLENDTFIYLTQDEISFSDADLKGVSIRSDVNTSLDGVPKNVGELIGVKLQGQSMSDIVTGTLPSLQCSGLFVVKYREQATDGDDGFYVISKNSRANDYVGVRIRASQGSDTGPWELLREQGVFSLQLAFAYKSIMGATYTGSGWEDFNYTAATIGMDTGVTSGSEADYAVGRRTNANDSVDIDLKPDNDGFIHLAFRGSSPTSRNVKVSWAGGSKIISTETTEERVICAKFDVGTFDTTTVTVTNNDPGRYMFLIGANVHTPDKVKSELEYDAWAHYIRPSKDAYVINAGASEYAMRDLDADPVSFVGSVHGREVAQVTPSWAIDGNKISTWTKNVPVVGEKSASLNQITLISGKITSKIEHRFGDGWIEFLVDLSGIMRSNTVYVGMCKPQLYNEPADVDCFNEILYPRNTDVSQEGYYPYGHSELFVWRNPVTERRVYSWNKVYPKYANTRGGCTIESSIGITTYSKLRNGLQIDAEDTFNGVTSHFIHLYC